MYCFFQCSIHIIYFVCKLILTLGRTREGEGGGCPPPPLSFLLEDKTSAPDVFSHCSFIHRAHFELSSVMVSFYGYEI